MAVRQRSLFVVPKLLPFLLITTIPHFLFTFCTGSALHQAITTASPSGSSGSRWSRRQTDAAQFLSGQCPILSAGSQQLRAMDRVQVDQDTGKRSFNARIVGIFSCLENDVASNDLTLDFRLAKPAIDMAVRAANERYSSIHFNVTYRTAPDICRHQQAAGHAADEYYVHGANYFVGPGCSESLASVGQLASYWNVPMCSTGYLPEMVTARFKPLTLLQLSLSVQSVGEMLLKLFERYKWRHLVILTDDKHPLHSLIRDGLLEFFHTLYLTTGSSSQLVSRPVRSSGGSSSNWRGEETGAGSGTHHQVNNHQQQQFHQQQHQQQPQRAYYINITARNFAYSKNKPMDYDEIMLDASSYSRIMLILARSATIGHLLEAAHNQGMARGQFVFIAHELFESQLFESSSSSSSPTFAGVASRQQKFSFDEKIEIQSYGPNSSQDHRREIYQPLMTISLRIPTTANFGAFRAEVAGLSEREFSYRMQPSSLRSLYSLGLAAIIYDCVMLYADRVNFVLNQTQFSKIDGKIIFEQVANRTFRSELTETLTINRAGQRVIDFTLNQLASDSLALEPVAHFRAIERRLEFLEGKLPTWALRNQSVPRSDPRCRIADIFCKYNDDEIDLLATNYHLATASDRFVLGVWLLVVIVGSVALTSSAIGWIVYRRFRIESELLNLWWSIKYEDILFEDEADVTCDGMRSMSSLAISNESFNEGAAAPGQVRSTSPQPAASKPSTAAAAAAVAVAVAEAAAAAVADKLAGCEQVANSAPGAPQQLSVCHSLGQDGQVLTAAHSASTLSVTAPSLGGSTSGLASATRRSELGVAAGPLSGANKLIPRISKGVAGSASRNTGSAAQTALGGSGKFSGGAGSGSGGGQLGKNLRGAGNQAAGGASAKDPSISSQNKNAKLRLGTVLNGARGQSHTTKVGLYKASRVAAKHLNVRNLNINRQLLIELRQVRDLTHENLIKFIGLCPEEPNVAIVSELCTRGNLQDLLQNETIRLDWPFRYSIINDIVDGLIHLHSSPIQYHGRLKSSNCVIDNRFVVKLTDFGLPTLLAAVELEENVNPRLLLWTAPEHLRTKHPLLSGSQKGDMYSLAIIFQEIITRCGPFECEPILCGASEVGAPLEWHPNLQQPHLQQTHHQQLQQQQQVVVAPLIRATDAGGQPLTGGGAHMTGRRAAISRPLQPLFQPVVVQHKQRLEPEEIVNLVRMGLSPPFRPYFRPDVAGSAGNASGDFNVPELISIVQNCWQETPAARPTVTSLKQQIKKMRRGCHLDGANLMDNLLQRMERYTDNLESLVEQKTAELMEEKKRSEELLYEMLPRFVVDQLKYGHSVTPEAYEAVTISFSDIKDFTSIAAQSSPIEVVNLLNQLYTEFDDCIARYDVYKVETIGDAYMVVSGLPVRNGDQHAKEIAEMSLSLLELIRNFEVVHLPHVNLELRIGIHSGPCASGVVGTRMFRYCLFGDTVNTASRMESHGEPMKIHASEDSANILSRFGNFLIEPRGQIEIKGKGMMNTYWLTGKTD